MDASKAAVYFFAMLGQPEFRSDHDPRIAGTATAPACARPPLRRRVRPWAIVTVILAGVLAMAAAGVYVLRSSFRRRDGWDNVEIALELLLPLMFVLWFVVRMRMKTGKWAADAKTRHESYVRSAEIRKVRHGRSLWRYALTWAGYVAFEPECPLRTRAAGWVILAGEVIVMLAVAAMGVIAIGASFADDNTWAQRCIFAGFGLLLFFLPGRAVLTLMRRRHAGQMRASREELDGLRAQRAAWRKRESEKPLSAKLVTTAVVLVSYGFLWIRTTVHHAQHPHESWVTAAIYTPLTLYALWAQFRRPKSGRTAPTDDATPKGMGDAS